MTKVQYWHGAVALKPTAQSASAYPGAGCIAVNLNSHGGAACGILVRSRIMGERRDGDTEATVVRQFEKPI